MNHNKILFLAVFAAESKEHKMIGKYKQLMKEPEPKLIRSKWPGHSTMLPELQEKRKVLWTRVSLAHHTLMRAKTVINLLESRYKKLEKEYEEVDTQLALLDGRYAQVQAAAAAAEEGKSKVHKKQPKVIDLTSMSDAQIAELQRMFENR